VRWARILAATLAALVALDLVWILVTGGQPLLARGAGPVALPGFFARAGLLAVLGGVRVGARAASARRAAAPVLVLALLLVPTLAQFQYAGGRINGDGVMYYVYVRSLWKDGDVDLTNEYDHYGLLELRHLAAPTVTGLRRSTFAVGPALLWSPFFGLGELVARAEQALGHEADLSGYGPAHRNAVALGSLVYGWLGLVLTHAWLRRHFDAAVALGAVLLVWGTSFLHWYLVQQPTMAHAASFFMAALVVWLWERRRHDRGPGGELALGLVLGLAMSVRWQNGVFLALPGFDLAAALRRDKREWRRQLAAAGRLAAGVLVGALPQMAVWHALYGMWLLPYPPQGTDFVRLDHPWLLETLFSSRHGLLYWTPALWLGLLGFVPLLRQRAALAAPLVVPLVVTSYVNMCTGDWWAGASFSNRRFDSLLPLLALGTAATAEVVRAALRARPWLAPATLAVPLVTWNVALAAHDRARPPDARDDRSFPALARAAAGTLSAAVGSPPAWPANWLFAWRERLPVAQYDRLVGRYLFYRQNALDGVVRVNDRDHAALLGEGWGPLQALGERTVRRLEGRARVLAPLDVPETLRVGLVALAPEGLAVVRVAVNGRPAGRLAIDAAGAGAGTLVVPAGYWRRELNDVTLEPERGTLLVESVVFTQEPAS